MFQIYTLPTCEHCHEATELMKQKNIEYESINTAVAEGRNKFREFYFDHRNEIKRDSRGGILLPVLVYQNNGTLRIHQGTEGLEKFLDIQ